MPDLPVRREPASLNRRERADRRTTTRRGRDAREFLPAALEILETPAHPLSRVTAITLATFFAMAVCWSFVGRIDIVTVAHGRIVPVGGTKIIQPLDAGTVRAIHVREGDTVRKGDLLIELDATDSQVDREQIRRNRMEASVEVARIEAMLDGLAGGQVFFDPPEDAVSGLVALHARRLWSDMASYRAEMARLDADRTRLSSELAALETELAKISTILPLVEEHERILGDLAAKGLLPRTSWLEEKMLLIESRHDEEALQHKVAEAKAALAATDLEKDHREAEYSTNALDMLIDAQGRVEHADLALRKADKRERERRLTAPVDGKVQQLSVSTIGGVVGPGETLMVVVPETDELEIEAHVLNRDKGFVHPGQPVVVKLDAFPFTKYGHVEGVVLDLSGDAIDDEALGPVYHARVGLDVTSIVVDGVAIMLEPGMSGSVEIRTGEQRIIDYLFSPIIRFRDEALRER